MDKEHVKRIRKIKIISGIIIFGFTLIIIFAMVSAALAVKPLKIMNMRDIETNLTNGQISELENFIWQTIKDGEKITEVSETIEALIRPSSYVENDIEVAHNYSFLVDIDEFKITYQVNFSLVGNNSFYEQPSISCPSEALMKYPDTYCNAGRTTTTSVTIGSYLPYEFRLDSGQLVIVTTKYDENGKDYLNVRVSSCGDEAIMRKAENETKNWITSHDLDPEKYTIKVPEYCDGEAG